MAHLGTLEGNGFVEWDDKSVPVHYRVIVSASLGFIDGNGSLDHEESLFEAFERGKQTLRLKDGQTVSILINHMGGDGTRFLTSGPIPGGWENMIRR